jgi:transposase
MCYELTDYEWAAIKPMLPNKPRGVPRVNDRRVLNGIFWVLRSGAPWRGLPGNFGPYTTCYNRFVRWRRAGVWANIHQSEIGQKRYASVRIFTGLATWSSGSSTRSNTIGVWQRTTTSSRPTTSHSSSLHPFSYGCALMSPRPSSRTPRANRCSNCSKQSPRR